ncbi:unnamed protein product [Clonostachys rosea f. rosea IK726]|uniref:Zn(2)-C6 fungal-type domain-containing protein n=2 Tax=Bionectria ochroleuca TaxID=29856 RepID=A0A0B7KHZ8_BIOOC|nr:unnamed protein product [Clonostachys rosea f. rosea IK726]
MSKETSESIAPRVWQACVTCRRKKIKCDGNDPCRNCSSRDLICEYPGSNDNASSSRNYAAMFEARFQQVDALCQRLEALTTQLTDAIEKLPNKTAASPQDSVTTQLEEASQNIRSLVGPLDSESAMSHTEIATNAPSDPGCAHSQDLQLYRPGANEQSPEEETDDELAEDSLQLDPKYDPTLGIFGSLVPDSYGRLRFIGGASNELLVQAIQSLTPASSTNSESPSFCTPGQTGPTPMERRVSIEIPLFVHGLQWRELPHLPKPEELNLPPRYVADMLVGLYFNQFHYTFPVLYKPHFMDQYRQLYIVRKETGWDRNFLSVFFAVCACASSLVASDGNNSTFPGLEYYERALLVHYSTTGQATMERAQCLALVSMCCAGWNTLSLSWHFAGQAVKAAQDLGMHLGRLAPVSGHSMNDTGVSSLEAEISRRIWWSIYGLDRVTSICLGRPMAINDCDCCCDLPMPVADEELEAACNRATPFDDGLPATSPLSGFLAFAQLCQISGKVHSLQSPTRIASLNTPRGQKRMMALGKKLEKMLDVWLNGLPDEIRFSANNLDHSPDLTMCIILFVVHAGSLLDLYRTFTNRKHSFSQSQTLKNCLSAARSCINATELVRDFVPPSHYMAFSVHYLTISGLALVWMKDQSLGKSDPDVEKCVRFLKNLEGTCSGASRGRAIIEQTLGIFAGNRQGSFLEPQLSGASHIHTPDLLNLDPSDPDFNNFWGTF